MGGIKISEDSWIDHVISNGEVGDVIGYTQTSYNNPSEWTIYQKYTDGSFTATYRGPSDFTWYINETSSGASCSGTFVKQ